MNYNEILCILQQNKVKLISINPIVNCYPQQIIDFALKMVDLEEKNRPEAYELSNFV